MATLAEIIEMVKGMPEAYLEETLQKVKEIKEKAESEEKATEKECPKCGSSKIVCNGRKHKKQSYVCRECGRSFSQTSKTAMQGSHSGATVWKQVIRDTVEGVAIDKTAETLGLHHETVFNMRHKILYRLEESLKEEPVKMAGTCEADETYVLESEKGRKFGENHRRKPRKHGAKASKAGISGEYVCVCASVTGAGEQVAVAVNRASPDGEEILGVFGDRVGGDTVVLCDGKQSYNALADRCTVAAASRINKVNGFHSFIKGRLDAMRGVATIFLNRYNALFSKAYAADISTVVDDIFRLMVSPDDRNKTIAFTQSADLLSL